MTSRDPDDDVVHHQDRPDDGLRPKLLSLFVLIFEYTYLTDSMRLRFVIITLIFIMSLKKALSYIIQQEYRH